MDGERRCHRPHHVWVRLLRPHLVKAIEFQQGIYNRNYRPDLPAFPATRETSDPPGVYQLGFVYDLIFSCGRIGNVIHSLHGTGRMWLSPSISNAVATFVAIWQNASCGVRTLIACQFRFSTSTIVLFNISLIKNTHTAC